MLGQRVWQDPAGPRGGPAPYGALVLRLTLGGVFVAHALYKVAITFPAAAGFFEQFGFAGWLVYPVFAVELVGGLMLMAGFRTRAVALALLAVIAGAFRVHFRNGWNFAAPNGGWEYLAVLAAVLVAVMLIGPGAPRVEWPRRGGA